MRGQFFIFGAGGHGYDIFSVFKSLDLNFYPKFGGFFDDKKESCGSFDDHLMTDDPHAYAGIGLNWPDQKEDLVNNLYGWKFLNIVHPSVSGHACAFKDAGIVICGQTDIGPYVNLDDHVHIGAGCTITRASIGRYSTIGPGVTICGDVNIGNSVMIGAGATICNLVNIGDCAKIGAGAVVLKDVPRNATVVGVPARRIK